MVLLLFKYYLPNFNDLAFTYFFIMMFGYLIYSYFGVIELVFLNMNNYLKQTYYFVIAVFTQIIFILTFINSYGILSFPLSITFMFLIMSLFIFYEIYKIRKF